MQNKNFTLDGSGKATITAPCPCEAIDLYIVGATPHTFTFQYALRPDEAPILAVAGWCVRAGQEVLDRAN